MEESRFEVLESRLKNVVDNLGIIAKDYPELLIVDEDSLFKIFSKEQASTITDLMNQLDKLEELGN